MPKGAVKMSEIKSHLRVKYAGDVHRALLDLGWELDAATAFVEALPDAEAEPVRHGEWVWADDGYCCCSKCAKKAPIVPQYQDESVTVVTKFCPNCGALMRGGF